MKERQDASGELPSSMRDAQEFERAEQRQESAFHLRRQSGDHKAQMNNEELYELWFHAVNDLIVKSGGDCTLVIEEVPSSENRILAAKVIDRKSNKLIQEIRDPNILGVMSDIHALGLNPLSALDIIAYFERQEPKH